jgi:tetratricopeptide (TPR) repeat protein
VFGRVVTANSPASRSDATNWESVLWHEFCHVVTLQLTRNRMPRWLSEGISVHEEHQADPAWGMALTPTYRQMILKGDLVPVGKLSAAFLAPKTPQHLQFAYLESALVVDFLVERFGREALRGVLLDLREGVEINAALARRTVPLEKLEQDFAVYARERAERIAPGLDWEKPDPALLLPSGSVALAAWEKLHPDNLYVLRFRAQQAIEGKRFDEARQRLERLLALYPRQKGADSAYRVLAAVLRNQGDPAAERAVLARWAEVDDEAAEGYLRWMELAGEAKDWPAVQRGAERYLAVNPLVAPPYRWLAQAATATGDISAATVAWRTLLQLDIPDAVEAHFQLARLLHGRGEHVAAREQVMAALEDAPRYRAALQLLLEIQRAIDGTSGEGAAKL